MTIYPMTGTIPFVGVHMGMHVVTSRNEIVAKVMFLHKSVILSTWGGGSPGRENPSIPGRTPPPPDQADPPPGKQTPEYGLRAAGTHPTGMHSFLVVTVCAGTSRNWSKRRKKRQLRIFSGYACGYGTALLTMVPLRSDHTGYGFDIGYVCAVVHLQTVTRFERESQPPHFTGSKNFTEGPLHRNSFHRNDFIFYIYSEKLQRLPQKCKQ